MAPEDEVPEGEAPARSHPLWTEVVRTKEFELRARKRVRKREHINISELRALLDAEMRRGSAEPNTRTLLGSDSQVVCGALVKGPSSSTALNAKLKAALPFLLGQNVYLGCQYVPTAENVADDPTRDRPIRGPQVAAPEWLAEAEKGRFEKLDAFLQLLRLDPLTLARLPEVPETVAAAVPKDSERELKRRRFSLAAKSKVNEEFAAEDCVRGPAPMTSRSRSKLEAAPRSGLKQGRRGKSPVVASRPEPWLPRRLLTSAAKALLERLPRSQFVLPNKSADLDALLQKPGHLDLFSGSRGAARALARRTGRWVLTFDIAHSPTENLLDADVRKQIEELMRAFLSLSAGPVCASFSRAVRPPVQSKLWPTGFPDARETLTMQMKIADGNSFAAWTAELLELALLLDLVVWIENPAGSFFWDQPPWKELIDSGKLSFFVTDFCPWGTPRRKRTKFAGNLDICGQKLLCNCERAHIRLVGYLLLYRCSWTKAAEHYPTGLCHFLARAVAERLKPLHRRATLDAAACARCCSRRSGEAKNPGPRHRQFANAGIDLERVELVGTATLLLQWRVRAQFMDWLQRELSVLAWQSVCTHPHLQVFFLRSYGNWLFQKGQPLYVFRHLVVFCQQQFPHLRPSMT